jgi:hypothetical protein
MEAVDKTGWNPRYTLYARSRGRDEGSQMEHDRGEYPGGCMLGFTFWIQDKWREFCSREGHCYEMMLCFEREFDEWLPGNLGLNPENKRVCVVRSSGSYVRGRRRGHGFLSRCGECRIPGSDGVV